MNKRPETHQDDVVSEMVDIATKHGYGVELVKLTWFSGIPNSEIMKLLYGDEKARGEE